MANPISQSELMKALDELILQEKPLLQDDDLTVNRLMERAKWNRAKAKIMIKKWQEEGKIEYLGKKAATHGRFTDAWRVKL